MKLKKYNRFVNEGFNNIDVDEANNTVTAKISMGDIGWTGVVKKEFPGEEDKILASINSLKWESAHDGKSLPFSQGHAIKGVIKEFKIPKVSMIAYDGSPRSEWIFGTKDEPGAAYTVFGVEGTYANGVHRIFFIDGGHEVTPVGAVLIPTAIVSKKSEAALDKYKEQDGMSEDAKATTPARKHSLYKKMLKFLDGFPNNTTTWAQATDEIRDMARKAREIHTEIDLDMLHDEWETNPNAPQPLDFRKIKTPSEWNTKGKEYILSTLDKMGEQAAERWLERFKDWF